MSWKVVNLVYSRTVGSAHRKAILAYMADRASDGGEGVYCSKGTIADETEIARSTVFKVIKELVADGVLIERGTKACTNGHTVVYDMDLARIEAFPEVSPEVKTRRNQSAQRTSPSGDQSASRTPPVRSTDPYQSASRTLTSLGTILEPPKGACAQEEGFSEAFWKELLDALGVSLAAPGRWWSGHKAERHVLSWLDLGLTEAQIVTAARESRVKHPEPPEGPKALDAVMHAAARAAKAAETPVATRGEVLSFWAEKLNAGSFVAPSSISISVADDLIREGLVAAEIMRSRGIAHTREGRA